MVFLSCDTPSCLTQRQYTLTHIYKSCWNCAPALKGVNCLSYTFYIFWKPFEKREKKSLYFSNCPFFIKFQNEGKGRRRRRWWWRRLYRQWCTTVPALISKAGRRASQRSKIFLFHFGTLCSQNIWLCTISTHFLWNVKALHTYCKRTEHTDAFLSSDFLNSPLFYWNPVKRWISHLLLSGASFWKKRVHPSISRQFTTRASNAEFNTILFTAHLE